jgi:hypothetical protein
VDPDFVKTGVEASGQSRAPGPADWLTRPAEDLLDGLGRSTLLRCQVPARTVTVNRAKARWAVDTPERPTQAGVSG